MFLTLLFSCSFNTFAQTIEDYIDNQWQDSRYTDNSDETVTDTYTGLMWKQCQEGLSGTSCATGAATQHTWKAALELASTTSFATYDDWRLPNINELDSLVAKDRYDPAINITLFPNTSSSEFWSSSPHAGYPDDTGILSFSDGSYSYDHRYYDKNVRLVRDE